jgi:YfiH family protein
MITHHDEFFTIYFGNRQQAYIPALLQGFVATEREPFRAQFADLKQLLFLHQVHGIRGRELKAPDVAAPIPSFVHDGDFLLTNVPQVGLGISTGDCLPIVIADDRKRAVSIVHAGWKGSVKGIAVHAVDRMLAVYGSEPKDLRVFFGPSAQACCYEVQRSFQEQFTMWPRAQQTFSTRGNKLYFDVSAFNEQQLRARGVTNITRQYQECTICTTNYCSVRAYPNSLERQPTVVSINC